MSDDDYESRTMTPREVRVLAEGLQDWASGTIALQKQVERLNADRNATIEECARVAERYKRKGDVYIAISEVIADAIRALKDKP